MPLINDMMLSLPPLQGDRDVIIPGEQTVKDIMREVGEAHREFAADYNCLPDFFIGKNLLRTLFQFCQDNLPYVMESENFQTTRSPTAILALADYWGCDCKHYSGFIAGVIDACNRAGYTNYDWCYRFASYDPMNPQKEHVFIVINDDGREIWVDPAPIENFDGTFTVRSFNDRKVIPFYQSDSKPKTFSMSLQRIRGCCPQNAYIGYLSQDAYLAYDDMYNYSSQYGGITRFERSMDYGGGGGYEIPLQSAPDSMAPVDQVYYDPGYVETQPAPEQVYYDPGYVEPAMEPEPATTTFDPVYYPTYDPVDAILPVADPTYGKIETLTRPTILDYPEITGQPIETLPSKFDLVVAAPDNSLQVKFDPWEFIKANPVETAVIGAAVIAIGYAIYKGSKKKKRA